MSRAPVAVKASAMELRHIRYFLAVAEAGNFTRAAAALGIAQPPLSQQIRALETEVGAPLFHRVPHGATLTAAGAAFRTEARLALAAAERAASAAQRAHRGESGQLTLGVTTSSTYNPLISATIDAFHHRWPDVTVSLEEQITSSLFQSVLRGEVDAAFVRPSDSPLGAGLAVTALPDEPMVIALPANHPLAKRESLRLVDMAEEPLILFPQHAGRLREEILSACAACGFAPVLGQEAQRTADTINLVAAHLGVSVVPQSLTQVRLAGVAYRPIEGTAPVARLVLAVAKGNRSPILHNFRALLTDRADTE